MFVFGIDQKQLKPFCVTKGQNKPQEAYIWNSKKDWRRLKKKKHARTYERVSGFRYYCTETQPVKVTDKCFKPDNSVKEEK